MLTSVVLVLAGVSMSMGSAHVIWLEARILDAKPTSEIQKWNKD